MGEGRGKAGVHAESGQEATVRKMGTLALGRGRGQHRSWILVERQYLSHSPGHRIRREGVAFFLHPLSPSCPLPPHLRDYSKK